MAILRLTIFAVMALTSTVSSQRECSEYISNYCRCIENPDRARSDYEETYKKYYSHLYEMRTELRNIFDPLHDQILRTSACPRRYCHYIHNYEDVILQRCGHCILGHDYEPLWCNDFRHKLEYDVCAWIVLRGPVLCKEIEHDHEDCDYKRYFHETFNAINVTCGGRCNA